MLFVPRHWYGHTEATARAASLRSHRPYALIISLYVERDGEGAPSAPDLMASKMSIACSTSHSRSTFLLLASLLLPWLLLPTMPRPQAVSTEL